MSSDFRRTTSKALTFLLMAVLIVTILSLGQHVLIPLALGILFSFLLGPLVRLVQRTGLKRVPAVVLVAVVAFFLFGMLFWAIGSQMVSLAEDLPRMEEIMHKKFAPPRGEQPSLFAKALSFVQKLPKMFSQSGDKQKEPNEPKEQDGNAAKPDDKAKDDKAKTGQPQTVIVESSTGGTFSLVVMTARELLRLIASIGVVVVLVIVTLIYKEELRDRFIRLTGSNRLTVTTKALDEAAKRISDYMFRKGIVNSGYGVAVGLVLTLLGVPSGMLWGIMAAVFRFIPSLGFWLALLPPALLALVAIEGWTTFFLVIGLFVVAEVVAVNVFESRFVGRQIGLLPVATLVSLSFWTWLWGPVGLLLGIPITLCLAVLGKYVPPLDFFNVLLSDQPAMDPTMRYYQRLIANDQDEATEIVEHYLEGAAAESVYDDLLLPALSHAKRDVANGQLTVLDQEFFHRTTREILDNACEPALPKPDTDLGSLADVKIAGCPIGDETDLLALCMVNHQLRARGYHLELGTAGRLSSEIVDWVDAESPAIACVLSVFPGELTQTRFVCKRLRARFPEIKLVVARLGVADDVEGEKAVLLKAGADHVCVTVASTGKQLIQVLQQVALQKPRLEPATS